MNTKTLSGTRPSSSTPIRSEIEDDERTPFATTGRMAFYISLLKRYRRLFASMMFFTLVYAVLSGSRALLVGVLASGLKAHYAREDAQPAPHFEQLEDVLAWFGVAPGPGLAESLRDLNFFMQFVYGVTAVAAVAAVIMVVAAFFRQYIAQVLVVRMVVCIREALFGHLTRQSVAYFNQQRSGDVTSRLTNDIGAVQLSFRFFYQTILQEPLTILYSLALAYYASPLLFMVVMPLYVVLMWPVIRSGKKVMKHGRGRLEKLSMVTEGIQQLFSGIRIVKAFGMERHEKAAFAQSNQQFIRSSLRMNKAKIKGRSIQELLYNLGSAGLLLGGVWLLTSDILDFPAFSMFMVAMLQVYTPLKALSRALNQVHESAPAVDRVLEVLNEQPQLVDKDGALEFPGLKKSIRFENVGFTYDAVAALDKASNKADQDRPVLEAIQFEVKKGEVIALVGPSGAGKSTIVDLLARFYDPLEGRITVDDCDIRDFRHASYLGGVAIVSQDPFLFNTTIRDNIRYGRAGSTDEEVEEAARVAFAHDFIVEQPREYDTVLGERGVKLSGGQRQRLTIARAVLKNAPILILDEATSALDSHAEKVVQRAIDNLMRDRTTFMIAHRLSTIVHANKILVLEEGRIVEEGTHDQLVARRQKYYHLWRSQNPGVEPE